MDRLPLDSVYRTARLEMGTLSKQVTQFIQNAIINGELKPGELIVESTVARALGISRAPVREAMRHLEAKGLVNIIPRRGIFVAKLSRTELDNIYGVRINLECLALKQAFELNGDLILSAMKTSLDNQQRWVDSHAFKDYLQENIEFHNIFIAFSRNDYLVSLLMNIEELTLRYRVYSLHLAGRIEKSYQDHWAIYRHLTAGKVEAAQNVLADHISSSAEKMKAEHDQFR